MEFTEAKLGRIFILRLRDDNRIHEVLESFAFEKKISTALCFFLGGAKDKSRIVVGPKEGDTIPPEPMITLLDGVHEAQGIGTIIKDEQGKPKLHMHASFGREKNTITGCVRMGVDVWRIGEVVILELIDVAVNRIKDKETGFEFLEIGT
ncbi:MAG: DNA-binding protein [Candidatus Bathyarchaeota archaeon]|jgi:predicted DNA-binding protein with PD1-like motif|nr:DNA-binding protein [Candidatus Bathyarchaeota archaeon]